MAISGNIFKTAEDAQAESSKDDNVGRFRSGYQVNGLPVALDHFRITTADPAVAKAVAEVMGSDDPESPVTQWETSTGEVNQVFTTSDSVEVIFDGPGSVRATLVWWGTKGKILESDGANLIEDGKVTEELDPDAHLPLAERKEKARKGTGPGPQLQAYFRLAAAPELGVFKYFSGSWTAMELFSDVEQDLEAVEGPVHAVLSLKRVEWEDRKTGETKSYTKPDIKLV